MVVQVAIQRRATNRAVSSGTGGGGGRGEEGSVAPRDRVVRMDLNELAKLYRWGDAMEALWDKTNEGSSSSSSNQKDSQRTPVAAGNTNIQSVLDRCVKVKSCSQAHYLILYDDVLWCIISSRIYLSCFLSDLTAFLPFITVLYFTIPITVCSLHFSLSGSASVQIRRPRGHSRQP